MTRLITRLLDRRWLVLAMVMVITIVAGISASRAVLATALAGLIFGGHPEYERYIENVRDHANDEILIVACETDDPFAPESRRQLAQIVDGISAIPDVRTVISPLPILDDTASPSLVDLTRGLLIAEDDRAVAVIVELKPDPTRPIERAPVIVDEVIDVFLRAGATREQLHPAGMLAVLREIKNRSEQDGRLITPVVALILLVVTYLLLGRLWPVLMTLSLGALAIFWMMGFSILLDPHVSMLLLMAPPIILVVAFSDAVHLCNAYLMELRAGRPKRDAIITSAAEVGPACFWTSLTTMVGFLALSIISVPGFRLFGITLGFGVAVALLLTMTLGPIILSFLPAPRHDATRPWARTIDRALTSTLRRFRALATRHPRAVVAVFLAGLAAGAWGSWRIHVETDFVARFSPNNSIVVDTNYFNEHFAGAGTIDLYLSPPAGQAPDTDTVLAFERRLESIPNVGRAISVADVTRAIEEGSAPTDALFRNLTNAGPDGKTRIAMFIRTNAMRETADIGRQAVALADTTLPAGWTAEPSGLIRLAGVWLDDHVRSERRALLVTFALIALLMTICCRSVRAGMLAMVPNIIPLAVVGGVLGFVWVRVDSDAAIAAVIAIGIAVDDTIHFLTRYRLERRRLPPDQALERAFDVCGRSIVMTSVIFAAGFAPMAASGYLTFRLAGTLLPAAVLAALAADLLLLPAMIQLNWIRFGSTSS